MSGQKSIKLKKTITIELECDNTDTDELKKIFNSLNIYPSYENINKIHENTTTTTNKVTNMEPDQPFKEFKEFNTVIEQHKDLIRTNKPIDNILHCVSMISNPCNFKRRIKLAHDFMKRMDKEPNVILYIVELVYKDQEFQITDSNNKRHLQLRTDIPLWHKENMLNIGLKKLLPSNWKAAAVLDMDIEFEDTNWAINGLKVLNDTEPVVAQLFSHALDLNKSENPMTIFQSLCYQQVLKKPYGLMENHTYQHPGYNLAFNRTAYDKMVSLDGFALYDLAILGSGDYSMMLSFIGRADITVNKLLINYHKTVMEFQKKVYGFKISYVPGTIRHYFHGSKINRKYVERNTILIENMFDPDKHITRNSDGILIPSKDCPQKLLDSILLYFLERNEDE